MTSETSAGVSELIERINIRLSEEGLFVDPDETLPNHRIVTLYNLVTPQILRIPQSHQLALGQIAIFEWTTYLLKGENLQGGSLGTFPLTKLDEGLYSFEVKNQIGRLQLRLKVNGQFYNLPLAVLSPKYPNPVTHLDFFEALLEDLIKRSASLPFHVTQPTAFAADESSEAPTAIFVYHFLRQYAPEIQMALETIINHPYRTLIDEDDLIPLPQAMQVESSELINILRQPQFLVRSSQSFPITRLLNGHAPTQLWQHRAEETLDTPPNRFAKQFLSELADWSIRLGELGWLIPHLPTLEAIRDELVYAQYQPFWTEIGSLVRFPAESQVLLKRRGYREWTQLWRRFHQARLPVWRQIEEAIDARDIATLYEIWCFFALVDRIGDTLEVGIVERRWQLDLSDEQGLGYKSQVVFGQTGYRLTYNEGFQWGTNRSYSVTLRPDFTLHGPNNSWRLVFDAKFRFEHRWFNLNDKDDDDEDQTIAKKADLYKMHTYRDALGAKAAVVLYPGDREIFYHLDTRPPEGLNWKALIQGNWAGIGAARLKPIGTSGLVFEEG